ncbi:SpoIIE family protein phosphatase [Antribacter sp. KLBMP9083]|uniref:SpoIIE family protein phosphatase n=1 Tax=Antribacter soli TaxID=2910976 RepID=A0AA41UBT3_9MICO|nr:GAF domain-containing SpoIIE family protein phosphatase [Antribacter soli]MCF4121424.1 SpoIIE family protein phosphatase [Antribacter soli]
MTVDTRVENGSAVTEDSRRQAVLDALRLLDSGREERFDRITRMVQDAFGVPLAFLNLMDDERVVVNSAVPGELQGLYRPREETFCAVTVQQSEPLVVPDATKDPRFVNLPVVVGGPQLRFYAGAPLTVQDTRIGTLCIVDTKPRTVTEDELAILEGFARWAERTISEDLDRTRVEDMLRNLQPPPVNRSGYTLIGLTMPAHVVGGDFYTWSEVGDRIDLSLADVMGKGVSAAVLAAGLRSALTARSGLPPSQAVRAAEAQLGPEMARVGSFATLLHAALDLETGELTYVDAGHGLSVHVRSDRSHERVGSAGVPFGLLDDVRVRTERTLTLRPGDYFVSVSDGVLELYDSSLTALDDITALAGESADADDFLARMEKHAGRKPLEDDVTVVVVAREPV